MKKILSQRLLMAITALMLNTYTFTQTSHTTTPFVIGDAGTHNTLLAELKAKNARTFNHFTNAYPEAILRNVRAEKDGTHINATVNGNILRVWYNNKGKFQSAVLSYPFSELSEKIAEEVMQHFPGYTVFGAVIDVTVHDKSALLVMIENKKRLEKSKNFKRWNGRV